MSKWKLVPEEPTEEMGMAAYAAYDSFGDDVSFGPQECIAVYKAMLAAAPPATAKDGMSERLEAAEQQVAVLVDGYLEILSASDEEMANGELAKDIADNLLCTLPDRAKKIQAVVEAAKHHEQIWRQKSDQGDRIQCGCGICQVVRDLES